MSEVVNRIVKRVASPDEWRTLNETLPEGVKKLLAAPDSKKRQEEQRRLDQRKKSVENFLELLYTNLGETGAFLSRHRTKYVQRLTLHDKTYMVQHSFPDHGLHDVQLHLSLSMDGVQLSGWRVCPLGRQGAAEWFEPTELAAALRYAAEYVDPEA